MDEGGAEDRSQGKRGEPERKSSRCNNKKSRGWKNSIENSKEQKGGARGRCEENGD